MLLIWMTQIYVRVVVFNFSAGAHCYRPYQTSVTTTQSGAWGVGERGIGHDGTY